MSVNYEWAFPQSETAISQNGLNDVVTLVHWVLTGTDDSGVTASCYGSVGLEAPNPGNFTSFSDLTKDQVEAWVTDRINKQNRGGPRGQEGEASAVDQMKARLADRIAETKNPVKSSKGFAFGA